MRIIDIFIDKNVNSFQIDEDLQLKGTSKNLHEVMMKSEKLKSFDDVVKELFLSDTFSNEKYYISIKNKIKDVFKEKNTSLDQVIVSNDLDKDTAYSFSIGLDYVKCDNCFVYVRIANFKILNTRNVIYDNVMDDYEDSFEIFELSSNIGKFIIDFNITKHNVYATDEFAKLLSIPVRQDKTYLLTRHADKFQGDNVLIREHGFFRRTDMLISGELEELTDEWFFNGKWLKVDVKVLKRFPNGLAEYIGGVIYDISELRQQEEFMYTHKIYEFAIQSGQIGVFFYDVDKYGPGYFDANDIYANLLGLERQENGYFDSKDFEKSLLGIESEIQDKGHVKDKMNELLSGEIEGTDNHVLKVKNLKSNKEYYMLSSSRIEERYENGEPRKIGGIIIDITERILNEKHQIEFANKDELTGLSNNRKLHKDMQKRKPGIGLFFDLDNFKKFNDTYGHSAGDQVLYEFSQALREASLPFNNVYVYRLYGDEFFVFAEGYASNFPPQFEQILYSLLEQRMKQYDYNLPLKASMGYAEFKTSTDIDDFIKEADYEMYKIKLHKRNK